MIRFTLIPLRTLNKKRTKIMKKIQADVVVIGGGTAGMGAFRNARLHSDNVYLGGVSV